MSQSSSRASSSGALRRRVREALVADGVVGEIDDAIRELLGVEAVELPTVEEIAADGVDDDDPEG